MIAPTPGIRPEEEADAGAASDGADRAAPLLARGQQRGEVGLDHLAIGLLDGEQDLGDAEQAHHDGNEADAVVEARDAEGEARRAAHRIDADHGDQQPEHGHGEAGEQRASGRGR